MDRKLPSPGMAFSLAQMLASKADGPRLFGVFENGYQIGLVERLEDNTVITRALTNGGNPDPGGGAS